MCTRNRKPVCVAWLLAPCAAGKVRAGTLEFSATLTGKCAGGGAVLQRRQRDALRAHDQG